MAWRVLLLALLVFVLTACNGEDNPEKQTDGQPVYSGSVGPATLDGMGVGVPFTATLQYSGDILPGATNSWSAASLPPGLTLAGSTTPSTTISGKPNTLGTFTFTVQVRDSAGNADTQHLTLVVR